MTVSAQKTENEIILNETLKQRLTAGIKFFFSNQIMLSAISLDMFAVLFGGAVALLPAFADNILHVGAEGLGILRAAPAVGSVLMGIYAAYHPPKKNAGLISGVNSGPRSDPSGRPRSACDRASKPKRDPSRRRQKRPRTGAGPGSRGSRSSGCRSSDSRSAT